jgi:hypothetical protein
MYLVEKECAGQLSENPGPRKYPKLIYYNKPSKGGHFAAWEQPQFYSEDIRAELRSLRKSA